MTVDIKKISDREYTVNSKRVYKDMTENWVADADMEIAEIQRFQLHISKPNA